MDITINGNIHVNGSISIQDGRNTEAAGELLDNKASFRELMAYLGECAQVRIPENGEAAPARAKRCPGSRQLRSGHKLAAQIRTGDTSCEVYENGYAVFDNGDRKTVVWVPECLKAVRQYYPEAEAEAEKLTEEQLADMAWYLAVIIAGENRIEQNLEHPAFAGSRSDHYADDLGPRRSCWSRGARFQNPEEAVLRKEERAERLAVLSDRQREVYELYFEENFTQEEIAAMTGISQQAVSHLLDKIRKKFRNFYNRGL